MTKQFVPNSSDLFLSLDNSDSKKKPPSYAIRSREVQVDLSLLMNGLKSGSVKELNLNFFKDVLFRVERKKQTVNVDSGNITWVGGMSSDPSRIAVLVVSHQGIHGSFDAQGEGLFTLQTQPNGIHIVEEIKRSAIR